MESYIANSLATVGSSKPTSREQGGRSPRGDVIGRSQNSCTLESTSLFTSIWQILRRQPR